MDRKGGHYGPLLVFQLLGCLKPKTEPWHIFGTKNNLKSHFGQFISLAAKGQQISMDIILEKFKNFEFLWCYAPQMKAENMYNSNLPRKK